LEADEKAPGRKKVGMVFIAWGDKKELRVPPEGESCWFFPCNIVVNPGAK